MLGSRHVVVLRVQLPSQRYFPSEHSGLPSMQIPPEFGTVRGKRNFHHTSVCS